ncbi:MAG: glycoside hydrolase family 127 protein [Clostridia bacterium]|nr:glycoside hydrolase family 127 protein [Clostridia bacterium]
MVINQIKEIENALVLRRDEELRMKLEGSLAESVRFMESNQICEVGLWKKFVQIFRDCEDGGEGWITWRSEFWGKMMRGASMVLQYTKHDKMYRILEDSVRDILTTEDELGRITGYDLDREFTKWDLWGRKYVMLGMMYFMEICRDENLNRQMIASMCRQADYIIERVGEGEGKMDIRTCSKNWEGLNSCSILEPIVRLYRLTANKKYLDFAEYIISTGFIQSANLIELAYADEVAPHDYPIVKAYEMMSCFEGLLQYYRITGIEKHKTALLNFGRKIMEGELSIIGCSGCTHELFDHTAVRQTQTDYKGIVQETCVTVTWMKFATAMLELSGEVAYADAIERSYYNAFVGTFNTHRVPFSNHKQNDVPQVLPFDSYSPLTADRRGRQVGGYGIFPDGTFYGCCACIGAAGAGIIPQFALMHSQNGITVNYYEQGEMTAKTPACNEITMTTATEYPYDGNVRVSIAISAPEQFSLAFRIPAWCKNARIAVNGKWESVDCGYARLAREWCDGDTVELDLPMPITRVLPPEGAVNRDVFAAYQRGPIVLAADKRVTDPDAVLDVVCDENGTVAEAFAYCNEIPDHKICREVALSDGSTVRLIDYASAGKTWKEDSRMAAWLRRKT